jgi:putative PIG3 family NAD(P)H quinone oxidoreductase
VKYIAFDAPGGADVLHVAEIPAPHPSSGQVLVAVEAAGVSHADVLQRQGNYPPPKDASSILGLEAAGTVREVGDGVRRWKRGDRVCALLSGGGYAELVTVDQGQVLPVPEGWSFVEAATLPENAFTVYDNLITRARLRGGEVLLVHGGTSGIGSTAIMFARAVGASAIATAGSNEKCAACLRIGATDAINYREQDFVAETTRITRDRGVDVVLDIVGGDYVPRDLEALAFDGRIVCLAIRRSRTVEIDLGRLIAKRATILGSSLRARTARQKATIAHELEKHIWPLLPRRDPIAPLVDSVYPFERAAEAHAKLESSAHIGKIVLEP